MKIVIKRIPPESTWPIRHEVMWPDQTIDYVRLPNDEEGIHYGLFLEDELVGVISAFITGNEVQFRKFATLVKHQGKGYGTQLLNHLLAALEKEDLQRIWCNARLDKQNFYKRFGLQTTDETFTKGGIDYVIMEKIT